MYNLTHPKQFSKATVDAIERHNEKPRKKTTREQILEVYKEAVKLASAKQQWPNGHSEILFNGQLRGLPAKVFIKNEGDRIVLFIVREHRSKRLDKRFYSKKFLVGLFKPNQGWVSLSSDTDYLAWNREVDQAMEAK